MTKSREEKEKIIMGVLEKVPSVDLAGYDKVRPNSYHNFMECLVAVYDSGIINTARDMERIISSIASCSNCNTNDCISSSFLVKQIDKNFLSSENVESSLLGGR